MEFNRHVQLQGSHAILSPSKYYWIGYDEKKLRDYYRNCQAMSEGIEIHDFARRCIERGVKLPKRKKTLNMYVNDAIIHGLVPEVTLFYSSNCFGTADAINVRDGVLYIFDLKTGATKTDFRQLLIYAALFSLEYSSVWEENVADVELRIYQSNGFKEIYPDKKEVEQYANLIVYADAIIASEIKA